MFEIDQAAVPLLLAVVRDEPAQSVRLTPTLHISD